MPAHCPSSRRHEERSPVGECERECATAGEGTRIQVQREVDGGEPGCDLLVGHPPDEARDVAPPATEVVGIRIAPRKTRMVTAGDDQIHRPTGERRRLERALEALVGGEEAEAHHREAIRREAELGAGRSAVGCPGCLDAVGDDAAPST